MGVIRKKGKTWYIDYRINGKRIVKAIGRSKKIAQLALEDIEVQIAKGRAGLQIERVSITEFFSNYINHINVNLSPRSAERYREIIRHFKNYLAKLEDSPHYLHEITPLLLEKYKQSRVEKIANQTINYEVRILKTAFNFAIKMGYLRENPAKKVSKIKIIKQKLPHFLTEMEINKLKKVCSPDLKDIILFLLNTGIRLGELIHLTWKDVDLEKKAIRITAKDGWVPKPKQEREIPLNRTAFEILSRKNNNREGYVFKTNTDNIVNHIYTRFKRACKRAGIENANLHTLRHSFASHLIMNGVDIYTVSKLLGHSSITMTEKYAHLAKGHLRQAVEKLKL